MMYLHVEYLRYYVSTTADGDVAMKTKRCLHTYIHTYIHTNPRLFSPNCDCIKYLALVSIPELHDVCFMYRNTGKILRNT